MDKDKLEVFELFFDETDESVGIRAVSFVTDPAIQQDFIYMSDDSIKFSEDEKKQVTGPLLIPDILIGRNGSTNNGVPFNLTVSKHVIEKLSQHMMINQNMHEATEQHNYSVDGAYMVQTWLTENEQDKLYTKYNFNVKDVPIGTWAVTYKVENDDLRNKIKSGEIKGYSIEGLMKKRPVNINFENDNLNTILNINDINTVLEILEKSDK